MHCVSRTDVIEKVPSMVLIKSDIFSARDKNTIIISRERTEQPDEISDFTAFVSNQLATCWMQITKFSKLVNFLNCLKFNLIA